MLCAREVRESDRDCYMCQINTEKMKKQVTWMPVMVAVIVIVIVMVIVMVIVIFIVIVMMAVIVIVHRHILKS